MADRDIEATVDIAEARYCTECEAEVTLVHTRNPDTHQEHTFWCHTASLRAHGPIETHKAVPR